MVPLGSCIVRSNCICHFGRWKFSCYHWTLDCTCRLDILLCGKVVISFQILWSCNAYYAWLICFTCSTQSHSSILAFGNRTKRFGLVFKVVMLICLPVPLLLWPIVGVVGSLLGGIGYGFFAPLLATFEAVGENVTNKFYHCFIVSENFCLCIFLCIEILVEWWINCMFESHWKHATKYFSWKKHWKLAPCLCDLVDYPAFLA